MPRRASGSVRATASLVPGDADPRHRPGLRRTTPLQAQATALDGHPRQSGFALPTAEGQTPQQLMADGAMDGVMTPPDIVLRDDKFWDYGRLGHGGR